MSWRSVFSLEKKYGFPRVGTRLKARSLCACGLLLACSNAFRVGPSPTGSGSSGEAGALPVGEAGAPAGGAPGDVGSAGAGAVAAGETSDAGAGGTDAAAGSAGADNGGAPPVEPQCRRLADCEPGNNCMAGSCVPALVSCAATKNSYPKAPDGVYWIAPEASPQRAFCDMALSAELCTEIAAAHQGRTRDKAHLGYKMTSLLLLDQGVCKLWAIRSADTDHPFGGLKPVSGVAAAQTCVALGFAADGALGKCDYGTERTTCGFSATPLYWYGNSCSGCALNDGDHDRWTKQGPAIRADILSNATGTTFTTCKLSK